jgi:ATP-dependent Clp protease ATP-binding subunit ClpC
MASRLCDVCGVRPATVAIRRIVPGGGQRVEHLCDVHAAQARGRRSSFGSGGLFDDFFNQFFQTPGGSHRIPIGEEATGRRAEQVDVTQFFSDSTNELLQRAAKRAMEWGSADLTSEHLLDAALEDDMVRHVLEWTDADPSSISAQLVEEANKGRSTDASPSLAPDAKRALLTAYEESRALGSSYIRASLPAGARRRAHRR